MKILSSCVVSAIALLAATSHAAEADKANVIRIFRDTVEPAQQQAYETAVKSYNKCLAQHGLKYSWRAWDHETGDTYQYSYAAGPYAWADFDVMREASKPCDATWRSEANAHLKAEISVFLVAQPELSRPADQDDKPALINATSFTLKSVSGADDAFTGAMRKLAEAAAKTKWPFHYTLYRLRGADRDTPDYLLVAPYANWAAYGAGPNPRVWEMVEAAYGKADADALHKTFDDALQDVYSHVDRFDADLTYSATAK